MKLPAGVRKPPKFSAATAGAIRSLGEQVVVTGGSGWLGRVALEMLCEALGSSASGRLHVFGSNEGDLVLTNGNRLHCKPMQELSSLASLPTLILNFAFLTRDRVSQMPLGEYLATNRQLSENVVQLVNRMPRAWLLSPSSGAVYAASGEIDTDLERNPYGVLKAQDEERFEALAGTHHGLVVMVPRVFNLAGPCINKTGTYVLASVLKDIFGGGPIRLNAGQRVFRSYLHVVDLLDVCVAALLDPGAGRFQRFDAAGTEVIEIQELASRAALLLGKPGMVIERPVILLDATDRYVGDGARFRQLALHHGISLRDLDAQIVDTAANFIQSSAPSATATVPSP